MFAKTSARSLRWFAIALIVTGALSMVSPGMAQKPLERLRVVSYNGAFLSFLWHVPQGLGIALGVELEPGHEYRPLKVEVKDGTVEDVLNAVVKSCPDYQWRRNGELFEFLPRKRATPLLDIQVHNFVLNGVNESQAIGQLMDWPEVHDAMKLYDLQLTPIISNAPDNTRPINVSISDVSLRTALTMIVKESGSACWVFQKNGPNGKTFTIKTRLS